MAVAGTSSPNLQKDLFVAGLCTVSYGRTSGLDKRSKVTALAEYVQVGNDSHAVPSHGTSPTHVVTVVVVKPKINEHNL